MCNMGVIPPKPGYLKHAQELCRAYNVLFYLDETVTGFRVPPGGAATLYGLQPDIVTYGKVLHYGSHNAPRLGLYTAKTMLEEMSRDSFAGFHKLSVIGEQIAKRLNQVARD
ncbi:aminotransferase class III-fold pyridoxal phosphate-dependent enzyme [Parasedimentitalea huanghaiensis]|uniref:Aminotransferase class III-fold pyridoxal phosphate-dependent enzyme n=1 Tax=Parasedimentitalea huanghaiensis TaxID=2682100 RepID=A0A6L6WG70_9RHOB|nr:aminotransferase class III-fold pyridoxal phosphate-dependent enzyme [Zongyanglinia huanghaiensis]MVO16460.1 aminotransferase class III-fold pyridoxal phosphate-dependent enzyme [Zongyanglinia huanghaiensis]